MTEPSSVATAAPAPVAGPTFADKLVSTGEQGWAELLRLDAREVGLNALMSLGVLILAVGLIWALRRLFDAWLARFAARAPAAMPDDHKRTPRAAGVSWLLLRLFILAAALMLVMSVWGVDPWEWITRGGGAQVLRLALIAVLATAAVEVAGFIIGRLVEGFARRSADVRRAAQLRTLGPLLKGSAQGVLIVIGGLTFLSELGVKVGPLLASAGVLGIAVGFGAQTLVKDFLTGIFLVAEDVVSVGDNVRIGDASGTVEAMTLRTIRLRSTNGTLHIFPYSEAQVIHNRTKVFSSYVFEVIVSYSADIDRALAVMAEVGDGLSADPNYADEIIRPFEVLGVDKLGDSGVTLKARLTTKPKSQWKVGREFNRRIKRAFEEARVDSPFQTIQLMPPAQDLADNGPTGEERSFSPPVDRRST